MLGYRTDSQPPLEKGEIGEATATIFLDLYIINTFLTENGRERIKNKHTRHQCYNAQSHNAQGARREEYPLFVPLGYHLTKLLVYLLQSFEIISEFSCPSGKPA